jgi:predicted TIM-barrel fold metal-dependent hydrolase
MKDAPGMYEYAVAANNRLQDQIVFGSAYPLMGHKQAIEAYKKLRYKG